MPQAALKNYLPDDAHWRDYNVNVLKWQCEKRKLSSVGTKKELIRRLAHYRNTHPGEKRRDRWVPKPPPDYAGLLSQAKAETFRVARVTDLTENVGEMRIGFLLTKDGEPDGMTVVFKARPACTCEVYLASESACVHIIYMLRYILDIPEPLRWQKAFLRSEIDDIYRRCHPVRSVAWPEQYRRAPGLCLICFRGRADDIRCHTCPTPMHIQCLVILNKVRKIDSRVCTICLDKCQLGIVDLRGLNENERAERMAIEAGRAVAGEEAGPDEDGEDSPDASRGTEQCDNAPDQAMNHHSRSSPAFVQQERSSPSHGRPLPSPSPRRQQQQPASSPLRRKQPSRAAKDIGLVRQSLTAAAEAPARTIRRGQERTPASTPASSQPGNAPTQTVTPVPVPVIPAQALLQIQQLQQQQRIRQAVHNFEAGRVQSGASSATRAPPFSATRALPFAPNHPQDPAARASTTLARDSAAPVQEPIAPAASAAPQAVEAPVPPALVPAPGPDAPAGSPAFSPATASASVSGDMKKRKATKLARKFKSLARESAYVREHADRELKRLAKKSKRLEKKAKALAKRNEADGEK